MKELAKHIVSRARKSKPYVKWLAEQTAGIVRQRGLKAGLNYLWTITFSIEDGVGLLYPLWSKKPWLVRYPGRIEIEVTTKCFLKCLKCEQVYWNEPQKSLSAAQVEKVLDEFPRLKAISLSGIGHNYQNPEYEKILKLCCDRSLYVQFFDTFLLLSPSKAKNLVDWGVTKVWMSIDGVDEKTVSVQQQGSSFRKVVNNAKFLSRYKLEKKARFPELGFTVVVTKYNIDRLPEFLDLFDEIVGESQRMIMVQFIRLIGFEENKYLMPDASLLKDAKGAVLERATKFRRERFRMNFTHFKYNIEDNKEPVGCCASWAVPFITVDGVVYPCCGLTEGNQRKFIDKAAFGNIFTAPFRKIWNGEGYKDLKTKISKNEPPDICRLYRPCTSFKTGPALMQKPIDAVSKNDAAAQSGERAYGGQAIANEAHEA